MRLTFSVKDESGLDRLMTAVPSLPLMRRLGKRVEMELRKWFRLREAEPNKKGWPKQHFWGRIRNETAFNPEGTSATRASVVIADPAFGIKVEGGIIRPKEKSYLAIPLRAEAYGKWPSSGLISGLFPIRRGPRLWLAARVGGVLRVFYRLVKKVVMPKDPKALPPEPDMQQALHEETDDFLDQFNQGGAA